MNEETEKRILKNFKDRHLSNKDEMSQYISGGHLDNVLSEMIRYTIHLTYNDLYKEIKNENQV